MTATTIESARTLGIEKYRAIVTAQHRAMRLCTIARQERLVIESGWQDQKAQLYATQRTIAASFLIDVLGISHKDVNAITSAAAAQGKAAGDQEAQNKGWVRNTVAA